MKKFYLLLIVTTLILGCDGLLQMNYDVSEITALDSRKLESIENFKVTGKMGNSVNLGFVNAFSFIDVNNSDELIYVSTSYKSLPANKDESLTLNLKFAREISFLSSKFLLFEEVKKETE